MVHIARGYAAHRVPEMFSSALCVKGESKGENKDQNQHTHTVKHPYYTVHTEPRENVQTVNKSVIKFITVCLSLARKHSHFGQCGII